MLRDRNRTSHIYSDAMAREIWTRIRDYAPVMRAAYRLLGARAG